MSLRLTEKQAQRLVERRSGHGKGLGRRSKFNARRTTVDGFTFASQAEARRYQQLVILGLAGELQNLELQPRFDLAGVAAYVADFRYDEFLSADRSLGVRDVVEDVKGVKTPVYRLKRKLFQAQYPQITFREVR